MQANPFHKSSFRPPMLMGAERKPMLVLMLACFGLNLISFNLMALGITAGLWFIAHPLLAWMGHVDPNLIGIYFRNLKYPKYIPAFTTPFRKNIGYVVPKEHKIWNR